MRNFSAENEVVLNGIQLFDELYEAFEKGVKMGIEEANYLMIKKMATLNIDLTLISDLTEVSIDEVVSIIAEKKDQF